MYSSSSVLEKIKGKVTKAIIPGYPDQRLTFSQCGEDIIVKYIFDCLGIQNPSYIDVGAYDPFKISNTALLHLNGSRGINIEPNPVLFSKFLEFRKEDINLNIGIGKSEEIRDFFVNSAPTLSTFSEEEVEHSAKEGNYRTVKTEKIEISTLQEVFKRYSHGKFPHFLNLDAEGMDEMIIGTIDFQKNFPLVICVETVTFSNSRQGVKNKGLIDFIQNNGYFLYADTYINSIFVRSDYWNSWPE